MTAVRRFITCYITESKNKVKTLNLLSKFFLDTIKKKRNF